ncbi:MAG: MBOAT family O-acyltransferase [Thermodesulfobacteriota bacterium]
MIFPSQIFLFYFLPLLLAFYYVTPKRYRNHTLLAFSYLFYLWGSGLFLFALLASTAVDFFLALKMEKQEGGTRKRWLAVSITFNLAILAYFKYSNFFIAEVNALLGSQGSPYIKWTEVVLPIGISFFTFQKITYLVDVYRKEKKALHRFVDYALYVALFPQLIAGPIVRFHEISDQLRTRVETFDGFYQGTLRFYWGLMKKVVLANRCGAIADAVFALNTGALDTKMAWVGVTAYGLQIYFDFSAYSDMAIGLGHMFGFRLPENFRRPYSSISITDFWRRWHITLSNFFRDYLYIPLGGNRVTPVKTYVNLMIVFTLCGLWHGANWTFIIWGIFHGSLLIIERLSGLRATDAKNFIILRRAVTLFLVMVGWVFFRAVDMGHATSMLKIMFVPVNYPLPFTLFEAMNYRNIFFMLAAAIVFFLPRDFSGLSLIEKHRQPLPEALRVAVVIIMVLYSVALIVSGSYNPFIYFQF